MKPIKKVAIVTTRQNYKWVSMQEVLPAIEHCWQLACDSLSIEHRVINVDVEPLREYAQYILDCDLFVVIAFNETIARFMIHARGTMGLPAPFVLHLYGHATLGLWPQARFGALPFLNSGDIFVGTCPGDLACMKITCSNAKTVDIPYPLVEDIAPAHRGEKCFAYIGRISDQKNLDIMIRAYALLSSKKNDLPILRIFGKEDHFGSPNMGIASSECLENLVKLIQELKLQNKIVFEGFQPRETIYQILGYNHVFVSASTHSDENFGMALMRSLAYGATAAISSWGGHKVFHTMCSERVRSARVDWIDQRPVTNADELSLAMEQALQHLETRPIPESLPHYFRATAVIEQFVELLKFGVSSNVVPLIISPTANQMYQQQQMFEKSGDIQRVFKGYDDPCAQLFLKAYL